MAAMGGKKFPEGLRVLAVDDDCVCLKVMEAVLRRCKYNPTMVTDAKTALKMLRAGKQEFDLVITDVRMPGMDGFKLLELIHLEMNLPVIMLSVDCDKKAVMKGITHGACDYLVKPVRTNELRNIWQHVERRRNLEAISHISIDDDAKTTDSESNDVDDFGENIESIHISTTKKKPRVAWTIELHNKFLEAIHQIGLDRAAPKTVLELMNVDYLTRENIASHLQKYRLPRKRVNSNPVGDAPERRKLSYGNMNNKGSFMRNHEHEIWRVSSGRMTISSPNHLSAMGNLAHLTNTQRNLCKESFIHGGRIPRYVVPQPSDAIRYPGSSNPPASQYNILNVDEFSTYNSVDSYADLMRGKLVETSKAKTPSNLRSSFANTSSSSGSLTPTNEYVVHPQESIKKYHNIMNGPSTQVGNPSRFPGLVGDYTKSWQSTGILHRCGTSFAPSHVNISRTQLAKYATPTVQMPLQIETTPLIRNTSSGEGFSEQAVPLNTPNNQSCVRMLDVCDSAPMAPSEMVKGGGITTSSVPGFREQMVPFNISRNTSSVGTMPNGNPAPVTNILDDEGTTDIHIVQEDIVYQPALNDQLDDINDFSWGDIFSNPLNEDFTIEDAFMEGE